MAWVSEERTIEGRQRNERSIGTAARAAKTTAIGTAKPGISNKVCKEVAVWKVASHKKRADQGLLQFLVKKGPSGPMQSLEIPHQDYIGIGMIEEQDDGNFRI